MKLSRSVFLIVVLTMAPLFAARGEVAAIKILSPADHAQVNAGEEHRLVYEVTLGPGGHHIHVWVDDKRGPGIHDLKGMYTLPKLSPGEHVITIKMVDKEHSPTGFEKSIRLIAK
jgi:hypothetical protein